MTLECFQKQMQRMYSLFGPKSYPQQRLDSIWKGCAILPDQSFEKIIDRFVDSSKSAPLPEEFKKLAFYEKQKLGLEIKEPESKPSSEAKCMNCADSGNLYIVRREKFEPWAIWPTAVIRCSCEIGRSRPTAQGPIWNHRFSSSYDIEAIYPGVKGDWKPRADQKLNFMVGQLLELMGSSNKKTKNKNGDLKSFGDHMEGFDA